MHNVFRILLLAMTQVLPLQSIGAPNPRAAEYDLKAAYLFHFIQFTEWPANPTRRPVAVCIDADHPLLPTLRSMHDKPVHGTILQIKTTHSNPDDCSVLVVSRDDFSAQLRDQAVSQHLLTITDDEDIAPGDVIISLRMQNDRVIFSINKSRATISGLNISSRLLRLAETVQ
jgi:hypothetical protein